MTDNELMVLMYETMQKQLNQFKDSRVVTQTLCTRVGELEKLIRGSRKPHRVYRKTQLSTAESGLNALNDITHSNNKLKDSVNAMRDTLGNVVTPGINLIGNVHKEMKQSIRDLTLIHNQVMDEFEQYELRLVQIEDEIKKIIKNQLLKSDTSSNEDTEDSNTNG